MNPPPPRAIIFDWDNTLVDSWDAIALSINDVRRKFGLPAWDMNGIKANCTRAARDSFPEWFGEQWQQAYDYYYRRFDEVRKSKTIKPLPGSEGVLRLLKTRGIPAFVVSNKHGNYLRLEIDMIGWQDLFAGVAGAQDTARDKPARDPVDFALAKAGLSAGENIWFAGDTEIDVQCARNAGCTPVLIGEPELAARLSVAQHLQDCHALYTILL